MFYPNRTKAFNSMYMIDIELKSLSILS